MLLITMYIALDSHVEAQAFTKKNKKRVGSTSRGFIPHDKTNMNTH